VSQARAARTWERRGLARAALLDADGALGAFAEAEARWSGLGATDGVCRAWVGAASVQLRGLGNLHEAALWLEQARGARGPQGSDAWARATLTRADLLFVRGSAPRAAALVDVVVRELEAAHRPPSSRSSSGAAPPASTRRWVTRSGATGRWGARRAGARLDRRRGSPSASCA
jgi:hypothetical protein